MIAPRPSAETPGRDLPLTARGRRTVNDRLSRYHESARLPALALGQSTPTQGESIHDCRSSESRSPAGGERRTTQILGACKAPLDLSALLNSSAGPAGAGSALFSSVNERFGPSQQFSKLVLVDQKVENSRQRTQREHKIPHGQSPARSPAYHRASES